MILSNLDTTLPSPFMGMEVSLKPNDIEERIKLRGNRENVYLSIGSGPWRLKEQDYISPEAEEKQIRENILRFNTDAIGECGLDFYHDYGSEKEQLELLMRQVNIAKDSNKPIILHMRDAFPLLLDNLSLINENTIMHCYSGDKEIMKKLLDRGAFISFAGNVTYKSNYEIKEASIYCPLDRILYETDSPYLTPSSKRGERNKPENSELTLSFIANERKIDKEDLKAKVISNFLSLMNNTKSVVALSSVI